MKYAAFIFLFIVSFESWSQEIDQRSNDHKTLIEKKQKGSRKIMSENFSDSPLQSEKKKKRSSHIRENYEREAQESTVIEIPEE